MRFAVRLLWRGEVSSSATLIREVDAELVEIFFM
nr:hypothetical protein RSP673_18965 [Ralstonia solanacearum P673]